MQDDFGRRLGERPPPPAEMPQRQRPVAAPIVAHDLHVGDPDLLRVLPREELAHPPVAALVVDAVDGERVFGDVIRDREQVELADQPRRQYCAMNDSSLKLRIAKSSVTRQSVPQSCGNHSRSSASGVSQIRRRSRKSAKPSAYGLSPL